MVDFVLSTLVLVSATLVLMGFSANLGVLQGRLDQPGAYWTFAMLATLPVHFMIKSPTWAIVLNVVAVLVMVGLWIHDVKDEVSK